MTLQIPLIIINIPSENCTFHLVFNTPVRSIVPRIQSTAPEGLYIDSPLPHFPPAISPTCFSIRIASLTPHNGPGSTIRYHDGKGGCHAMQKLLQAHFFRSDKNVLPDVQFQRSMSNDPWARSCDHGPRHGVAPLAGRQRALPGLDGGWAQISAQSDRGRGARSYGSQNLRENFELFISGPGDPQGGHLSNRKTPPPYTRELFFLLQNKRSHERSFRIHSICSNVVTM